MASLLLDTHAWVWSFAAEALLSPAVRAAIVAADAVYVSPISFLDIGQKVRHANGPRWRPSPCASPTSSSSRAAWSRPSRRRSACAPASGTGPHRDLFDRLLAATCESMAVPLVTRDPAFAGLAGIHRI